jgi:hypothetical protein
LAFSSFEPVLVEVTLGFDINRFRQHARLFRRSMLGALLCRELRILQSVIPLALNPKIDDLTHPPAPV